MSMWEQFGASFQDKNHIHNIHNIHKIPNPNLSGGNSVDCVDIVDIDQDLKMASPLPMPGASLPPWRELPQGGAVPDYQRFCGDYWMGCSSCPEFMEARLCFCRRWNRREAGADVVACVPLPDGGAELLAVADGAELVENPDRLPERPRAGAWRKQSNIEGGDKA